MQVLPAARPVIRSLKSLCLLELRRMMIETPLSQEICVHSCFTLITPLLNSLHLHVPQTFLKAFYARKRVCSYITVHLLYAIWCIIPLTQSKALHKITGKHTQKQKTKKNIILLTPLCKMFWTQCAGSEHLLLLESLTSVQTAQQNNSWSRPSQSRCYIKKNLFKWV